MKGREGTVKVKSRKDQMEMKGHRDQLGTQGRAYCEEPKDRRDQVELKAEDSDCTTAEYRGMHRGDRGKHRGEQRGERSAHRGAVLPEYDGIEAGVGNQRGEEAVEGVRVSASAVVVSRRGLRGGVAHAAE